ncbi:hypothetical protein ABPG72_017678, partial [Tetrahymena utriculariae]
DECNSSDFQWESQSSRNNSSYSSQDDMNSESSLSFEERIDDDESIQNREWSKYIRQISVIIPEYQKKPGFKISKQQKRQYCNRQQKMDTQQNSSQGQEKSSIQQTSLKVDQPSQQVKYSQKFSNQEGSSNIFEDTNIQVSTDKTIQKKLKRYLAQNALCYVINQKKDQHKLVSNQNQENKNFGLHFTSKNSNYQNYQQNNQNNVQQQKNYSQSEFQNKEGSTKKKLITIESVSNNQINCEQLKKENTGINLQEDEQQHTNEQILKHNQPNDQGNLYHQENAEKKILQQDENSLQSDFSHKEDQQKQKLITQESISNNHINCKQPKEIQEITDIDLRNEELQTNKVQTLKNYQIADQENAYEQENNERKIDQSQKQEQQICNEEKVIEQPDHMEQKSAFKQQNVSKQANQNSQDRNISPQLNLLENSCLKLKQSEQKENLKKQQNLVENFKELVTCSSNAQKINKDYQISQDDLQKQENSTIQQEIQSISNKQQFEVQQNDKNLNILSSNYSSQLKTIFDQIEEYKFKEYEKSIELDQQASQVKKEWEQEIFQKININKTQSGIFQTQKSKIFEILKQDQYYLCSIIYSNQMEDLIVGFQDDNQIKDECENFNDEYIFKIIYNSDSVQSDIDSQNQLFETLGFQFKLIKLDQEKISIFILTKSDFLSISKTEYLANFKQNIQQIENNYEINSQNCQECKKCRDQKTCQNQNCFKNAILTNQGDIAVGLGVTMMAGVDVAHLWWDDSKVQIVDRNYINPTTPAVVLADTERSDTNDFVGLGQTFDTATGNWVATFNRKLNTGDMYDNVVADGGQIQLSVVKFSSQTWGAKHSAAYYQTVKLTSQASNAMTMTIDGSALFSFAALIFIVILALFGEN